MIEIEADVFDYDEDLGASYETFVVTTAFDVADLVPALHRAAQRFMLVDESGVEHPTFDAMIEGIGDLYTPNYVSDPAVTPAGIQVYVDCKGVIETGMAATFRRILREELGAAVPQARVVAADFSDGDDHD
ncbi:hypothetical protein [Nocardioides sp.]|uniref:hypothetical protein n=1 Tax=Nocardioides sp. TaxID=35761 RepID=UPI002733C223|nr:hypothetical protein [Nocardioides sp.]MDP3891250.1 hypothetical protein [Nocardioides sp.]